MAVYSLFVGLFVGQGRPLSRASGLRTEAGPDGDCSGGQVRPSASCASTAVQCSPVAVSSRTVQWPVVRPGRPRLPEDGNERLPGPGHLPVIRSRRPAWHVPRLHPATLSLRRAPPDPLGQRRPHQPGQPPIAMQISPSHRDPPLGLDPHLPPRRHHHRHRPRRTHPALPRTTYPGGVTGGESPRQATPGNGGRQRGRCVRNRWVAAQAASFKTLRWRRSRVAGPCGRRGWRRLPPKLASSPEGARWSRWSRWCR